MNLGGFGGSPRPVNSGVRRLPAGEKQSNVIIGAYMKACPTCNRTYPDETLAFCLVDGSILSAPYDPHETQHLPAPRSTDPAPTEVLEPTPRLATSAPSLLSTIQSPQPPPLYSEKQHSQPQEKRKGNSWIALGAVIIIVAIGGVLSFLWLGKENPSANQSDSKVANTNPEPLASPALIEDEPLDPPLSSIEGTWCFRGVSGQICTITEDSTGRLQLVTEKGVRQSGESGYGGSIKLDAPFTELKGQIVLEGKRINWSNGEWWERCGVAPASPSAK